MLAHSLKRHHGVWGESSQVGSRGPIQAIQLWRQALLPDEASCLGLFFFKLFVLVLTWFPNSQLSDLSFPVAGISAAGQPSLVLIGNLLRS